MRILLVSGVYPPLIGGPSAQTHQLALGFVRRGVDVQVVTFGERPHHKTVDGVPVIFLNGSPRQSWTDKIVKNWQVYQQLCQIIEDFRPQVVHQQTAVANLALYTGLACRKYRIPNLLKYSSDLLWERVQQKTIHRKSQFFSRLSTLWLMNQQRFLFSLFDRIWVTTPPFQTQLHESFNVALDKIDLLPNFIDLSAFEAVALARDDMEHDSSQKGFVIAVISRLQPWKGVDTCIQALAELRDLPLQLRIVGRGSTSYEAYLHTLAQTLDVTANIDFVGQVSPLDIHQQYQQIDLFVQASSYEPFGIVLVEAMAAGVPIVATHVGGIPTVVEEAAVLVPPNQAPLLAQAIRTVVTDDSLRASLRAKGRQRAQIFGLEQGIHHLLGIYNRLAH